MKHAILFAALTLISTQTFASKARIAAFGTSQTDVQAVTTQDDVQDVFTNPAKMFNFGNILTVETGANPEGGVFMVDGDKKWGFYVGGRSTTFTTSIQTVNALVGAGTFLSEQTPFEFFYGSKGGDMNWAVSAKLSMGEDKVAEQKVSTGGIRAGVTTSAYEAYVVLGLLAMSEKTTTNSKIEGDGGVRLGGEYFMGEGTLYADIVTSGTKVKAPAVNVDIKTRVTTIQLGYEMKTKSEGAQVFYGAKLFSDENKIDNVNISNQTLPIYFGVEAEAASWLTLRGFVSQAVLLNTSKRDAGLLGAKIDKSGMNNSKAALGASFLFGNLSVDGTLTAGGTGNLNTDTLLAQTSLNYKF